MATYLEIADLRESKDFGRRIDVALLVSARAALNNANSTPDAKAFAKAVMTSGIQGETRQRLINRVAVSVAVLAAGSTATDTQIQTVVDNEFLGLA